MDLSSDILLNSSLLDKIRTRGIDISNQEIHEQPKPQPRFFYGYIIVAAAFLIMLMSFGAYNVFGVFFKPVLTEFGWTRAVTSGAFSLSMIISGLLGVAVGGLNDRFGPRIVLTVCGLLLGLGYLLMSQITSLWQFYLFYGVIIGTGMSGCWVPTVSTAARWFIKRRGIVTGFVVAGMGISGLLAPPAAQALISSHGWAIAYAILGSALLVVVVSAAQFLRRDPMQKSLHTYGHSDIPEFTSISKSDSLSWKQASMTRQFWLFLVMEFCLGFSIYAVRVHIVAHGTELGLSAVTAANILATMGGASIFGNIVLGIISDRIGNRRSFFIVFVLISAALFWLVPSKGFWKLLVFAGVSGFAHGGGAAIPSPLAAELFGLKSHGLIYGALGVGFTLGASIGPFVTGYIFDITGSYRLAFLISAAIGILACILTALLTPLKRQEATQSNLK